MYTVRLYTNDILLYTSINSAGYSNKIYMATWKMGNLMENDI